MKYGILTLWYWRKQARMREVVRHCVCRDWLSVFAGLIRLGRVSLDDLPLKTEAELQAALNLDKRQMGFVVWDSLPPAGIGYQTHKLTFLDALETGFAFMRTRRFLALPAG